MYFNEQPNPELKVSVIVPVKDEEENISNCLDSLRCQFHEDGNPFNMNRYEILVLTNNCNDNSYSVIEKYHNKFPKLNLQVENLVFPEEKANIGTARRFLMDMAFDRFSYLKNSQGIIASTDGDTRVDKFWLSEIVKEIEKGCDVVGGEIIADIDDDMLQQYHVQDILYHNSIAHIESLIDPVPHNPWPSHFQCFGASLAVTCAFYEKAGRLPLVPYLEDMAFCRELELIDAKIRKSLNVKVFTSSRTAGRVERGLSQQLAFFKEMSHEKRALMVASADSILSRLKLKRFLRECWQNKRIDTMAKPFKKNDVKRWLTESTYFGEVWAEAESDLQNKSWFDQWEDEPIDEVLDDLEKFISSE